MLNLVGYFRSCEGLFGLFEDVDGRILRVATAEPTHLQEVCDWLSDPFLNEQPLCDLTVDLTHSELVEIRRLSC